MALSILTRDAPNLPITSTTSTESFRERQASSLDSCLAIQSNFDYPSKKPRLFMNFVRVAPVLATILTLDDFNILVRKNVYTYILFCLVEAVKIVTSRKAIPK